MGVVCLILFGTSPLYGQQSTALVDAPTAYTPRTVQPTQVLPAQEWTSRVRWSHARGRANLATLIPMGLGGIAYSIDEARGETSFKSPLFIAGTCLSAVGIAVGPSMGLWCTGNTTPAWLSFGVRTAGLGAIGIGMWRTSRILDDAEGGFAWIAAAPFVLLVNTLPGIIITAVGAGWALNATPNRFCDSANGTQVSLTPRTDTTGGQGLALTVRW